MEKEYSTITTDGRILQNDNAIFQGQELARVDPAETEEALRYFTNMFSNIEKYVETYLKSVGNQERGPELLERLKTLREEVVSTKAIGDFETLVGEIDAMIRECEAPGAEASAGPEAEQTTQPVSEPSSDEPSVAEPSVGKDQELGGPDEVDSIDEAEGKRKKEYPEALAALVELADKADDLANDANWQTMQSDLDNIRFKWEQVLEEGDSLIEETGYEELVQRLDAIQQLVAEKKSKWVERRRERKQENLGRRAKILDQLQHIVDKKKWQAIKQVGNLTHRWEEIKDLPNEPEVKNQDQKYHELINEFNEKKVAYLIKKAQKEEENLAGKLAILDKLNLIVASVGSETESWKQLDKDVEGLSRQWRKIGHVPAEQSDSVWGSFKAVRDEYFNKKMEHNKEFREQVTKNIRRKVRLCELVEALLKEEDLAVAVREMNNLHKKWKKIDPVPKEKNDELWERFSEASQKFNEKKSKNQDLIRDQEQQNLNEKLALCEKAEEVSKRTDWGQASAEMETLMKSWKEKGPVPRRKAGKVWKRFKKAMDEFYDNRRKHFKSVRDEQKENYSRKKEIVAELEKLGDHENPEEAVEQARQLQEQFRKIGFVPIKKKSKIEKEYKEACDRIYQKSRTSGRKAEGMASNTSASADKSLRAEYFKLKKECDNLHEEIMRYMDTKTFINPGGKGNALIDQIQQKIDKSQKNLDQKQEKLEELRQKIEE